MVLSSKMTVTIPFSLISVWSALCRVAADLIRQVLSSSNLGDGDRVVFGGDHFQNVINGRDCKLWCEQIWTPVIGAPDSSRMINDGTEVWQDDTCQGGGPTHRTHHLNPLFRLIQDHHWPRPTLFRPGWWGEADVVICFTRLRLEEVWLRGITTKIELDRLNAELVVEDII